MKNIRLTLTLLLITAAAVSALAQGPCVGLPVINIAVSDDTPCAGEEITLTASGAQTYLWNNNVQNGVSFAPSVSEAYEVVSIDSNGCRDTSSVMIDVLPLPNIVANASSLSICLDDSIQLNASGATSYTWIEPNIANGDFFVPTATGANVFSVEGPGDNGCVNTSQVIVVVKGLPEAPSLNLSSVSACVDVAFDDRIEASTIQGRALWFRDQALTQQFTAEPVLTVPNDQVGTWNYYASSFDGGCFSEAVAASVEVFARPEVEAGSDISIKAGEQGRLNGSAVNAFFAEWSPTDGLSDPNIVTPEFTATNSQVYTLTVNDENGCTNADRMLVNVSTELIISNAMTPNGDGDNDVWKIYPETVLSTCNVRLFDGFGRLLWETDNYGNDWDGTYEGSDLPDGDYYYHIECNDFSEKGTLIIIN